MYNLESKYLAELTEAQVLAEIDDALAQISIWWRVRENRARLIALRMEGARRGLLECM